MIKAQRLRGQAFLAQGNLPKAEQALAAALDIARNVGNLPQLWSTWASLGDLRRAQGAPDQARAAYGQALAVIEGVARDLTDAQLRHTFLHSPGARRISDAA